jgi:hypothetical protein
MRGVSEDGEGLLEFLSIGRSKKESLFAPQKQGAWSFIILNLILSALTRFDCLHLIIIVEIQKKE